MAPTQLSLCHKLRSSQNMIFYSSTCKAPQLCHHWRSISISSPRARSCQGWWKHRQLCDHSSFKDSIWWHLVDWLNNHIICSLHSDIRWSSKILAPAKMFTWQGCRPLWQRQTGRWWRSWGSWPWWAGPKDDHDDDNHGDDDDSDHDVIIDEGLDQGAGRAGPDHCCQSLTLFQLAGWPGDVSWVSDTLWLLLMLLLFGLHHCCQNIIIFLGK